MTEKQALGKLNLKKLGKKLPVSDKLVGDVVAKVLRTNNTEDFAVGRWNDKLGKYNIAYDESLIGIKEINAVYSNEEIKDEIKSTPKPAPLKATPKPATVKPKGKK